MAFCSFASEYALFDCTPLENLFIQEYMLRAPGDYVKVYIYGLMQCHHPSERMSLTAMAKDLGLEEGDVQKAFAYWERERLVKCVSDKPRTYAFVNLKQAQLTANDPTNGLYKYKDFNRELDRKFSGKRNLYPQDLQRVYDWVEQLELPMEVALMLVQHMIDSRGIRFSFERADAVAVAWAQNGVKTIADAEEMARTTEGQRRDLKRVLRKLGQRREPSQVEEETFDKWVRTWGFDVQAILRACDETIKGTPTMAYLDAILARQRKLGNVSAHTIDQRLSSEKKEFEPVKALYELLGRRGGAPTEADVALVASWLEQGFEWEVVALAARAVHRGGSNNIESVGNRLEVWRAQGLTTQSAVEGYLARVKQSNTLLNGVYATSGIEKRPTQGDRTLLDKWHAWGFDSTLILLAASYAQGTNAPMPFIDKILSDWNTAGIKDVDAAKREHDSRQTRFAPKQQGAAGGAARPVKEVAQHRYTQREYAPEDYDALVFDIMADEGTDGGRA